MLLELNVVCLKPGAPVEVEETEQDVCNLGAGVEFKGALPGKVSLVLVAQLPETAAYADSGVGIGHVGGGLEDFLVFQQGVCVFAEGEEGSGEAHDGHDVLAGGSAKGVGEELGGLVEGIFALRGTLLEGGADEGEDAAG